MNSVHKYKLVIAIFLGCITLPAQHLNTQKHLEAKRLKIEKEIKQYNKLISKEKDEQRSLIYKIEDINYRVSTLQNLIKVTNQQANLLTREINTNIKNITILRDKLKVHKADYAKMIVKSYKSRSDQNKIMFLLSSNTFHQAYKRLQYIKQYANYQRQQGDFIKGKALELQALNTTLLAQRKEKNKLIANNKIAKQQLNIKLQQQEELIATINKDIKTHRAEIKAKERERIKIDNQIDDVIKAIIAKSNAAKANKAKKSKSKLAVKYKMTPAEKSLSNNFTSNKGKLPWPVRQGNLVLKFGKQRSLIDNSISINSNGVRIVTNTNEKVRAVYRGVVSGVVVPKNGNNVLIMKHGNYFTVYKNLSKLYVKTGDAVATGDNIGEVLTDKASGKAILSFAIYKNRIPQNPAYWIDGM